MNSKQWDAENESVDGCCKDKGQITHRARLKCNHSCYIHDSSTKETWKERFRKAYRVAYEGILSEAQITKGNSWFENFISQEIVKNYEQGYKDAYDQILADASESLRNHRDEKESVNDIYLSREEAYQKGRLEGMDAMLKEANRCISTPEFNLTAGDVYRALCGIKSKFLSQNNMDYALAKELKDAGFPFSEQKYPMFLVEANKSPMRVPTLEELIKACGESFGHVARLIGGKHWRASGKNLEDEYSLIEELGSIPTEAVARLWLALNAQKENKDI